MTKVDPDIVLVLGNPHTLFVALGLELFVKKTKYRIIDRTKEMVNVETANFFTDYLPLKVQKGNFSVCAIFNHLSILN
jgi:hypothetical protein